MRATMDGPATGQHDVKTGKKTGPPPRGDAILPHWGGGNFFTVAASCGLPGGGGSPRLARDADGSRPRQSGRDRILRCRSRRRGRRLRVPAVPTQPTPGRQRNFQTVVVAGGKHQHRVGAQQLNVTAKDRGNSRRAATLFSTKTGFLIQIAGRWVQPGYSRAGSAGAGPDKPVIVVIGGGAWWIHAYFWVEPCISVMGQPLTAPQQHPHCHGPID
jgi:hypothetical protein